MKRPRGFDDQIINPPEVAEDLLETIDLQPVLKTKQKEESLLKKARKEVRAAKREVRRAKSQRKKKERREKKRFTAFNRSRRRRLYVISAAILGLAVFVGVGVFTPVMSVRVIEVQGAEKLSKEELKLALEPLLGTPIALVQEAEVEDILRDYSLIEKYSVLAIPPETLSVVIIERTPALAIPKGDDFLLVDVAGVVTQSVTREELPEGVPQTRGRTEDVTSKEFQSAALVTLSLDPALKNRVVSVEAETPFSVTLTFDDGFKVLWGDVKDNSYKGLVLESILEAVDKTSFKLIDVSSPKSPVFK